MSLPLLVRIQGLKLSVITKFTGFPLEHSSYYFVIFLAHKFVPR